MYLHNRRPWSATTVRILAATLTVLLLLVAGLYAAGYATHLALKGHIENFHYDFGFFYWAFHVVWHHQPIAQMYDKSLEQRWMLHIGYPNYPANEYVYPPQFAVLFAWMGAMSYRAASFMWLGMSFAGYALSIALLYRLGMQKRRGLLIMFFLAICVANDSYYADVMLGNVTWLLLLLLCGAFYWRYKKNWRVLAGVLIGLAAVIKITPAILLFYYALRREWKMVGGILIGVGASTALTVAVVGWRVVWDFVFGFSGLLRSSMSNGPAPHNLSFEGILAWVAKVRHIHSHVFTPLLFTLVLIVLAVLVIWLTVSGRVVDPRADMVLAPMCVLLFSPLLEGMHLLLMEIPMVMVLSLWWGRQMDASQAVLPRSVAWFVLLSVSVLLLSMAREVLQGATPHFQWLIPGYLLFSIAAFLYLAGQSPAVARLGHPESTPTTVSAKRSGD